MPPIIDADRCIPCAVCVEVGPEDVFFGSPPKEVPEVRYPEECYHCAACVTDCPTDAITLFLPLPLRL